MTRRRATAARDLVQGVVAWDEVDWDRAQRVRFHVGQRFAYRYPTPITKLDHRLMVLPPRAGARGRRIGDKFTMDVVGTVAEIADGFGNAVLAIHAPHVQESVSFATEFVVEQDRVPPDAPLATSWLNHLGMLTATSRTAPGPRVVDLARHATGAGGGSLAMAESICAAVRSALIYGPGMTDVDTSAEAALAAGGGVCQDYAHVMIAACRAVGIPARYVSGHLVGEGGTHAWVEAVIEDGGRPVVRGFDPTHGRVVGMTYLAIAAGRDYGDVAPTSGTYVGETGGVLECARRMTICGIDYERTPLSA